MDILSRIAHVRFLGSEFLTWLWYRSELNEGQFDRDGQTLEVWFDAKLVLESLGDIKEQSSIKAENPTDTEEARASLQTGKQVREARLRIVSEQKQWTFTMKAEDLAISGLKIPALLSREDEEQLFERFYLTEELHDILDALFQQFARLRLEDDPWRRELAALRDWVREGQASPAVEADAEPVKRGKKR